MTLEEAQEVLNALVREGVDFVVIGGMAMAAQGLPRATQDLDFFVAPTRENLEALKRALPRLFNDPAVDEIDPDELLREYPAIQNVPLHGRFSIDVLTLLGDAFSGQDVNGQADELKLGELVVRVASPRLLYAMKKDTVRMQDRADAARIREAFDLEES